MLIHAIETQLCTFFAMSFNMKQIKRISHITHTDAEESTGFKLLHRRFYKFKRDENNLQG